MCVWQCTYICVSIHTCVLRAEKPSENTRHISCTHVCECTYICVKYTCMCASVHAYVLSTYVHMCEYTYMQCVRNGKHHFDTCTTHTYTCKHATHALIWQTSSLYMYYTHVHMQTCNTCPHLANIFFIHVLHTPTPTHIYTHLSRGWQTSS